jgi:hypothetical protein
MLAENDVRLHAHSLRRKFEAHKHIGDYRLFMLGMFPMALTRRTGKEFLLGRLILPGSSLSSQYELQGRRSYRLATEFSHKQLFTKLSTDFPVYRDVLELVRIFLDASGDCSYARTMRIIENS